MKDYVMVFTGLNKWLRAHKDLVTNVVAIFAVVLTAVQTYLNSNDGGGIDYFKLGIGIAVAIVGWYTGKYGIAVSGAAKDAGDKYEGR